MKNRTRIPLLAVTVSTAAGSDPDVIEHIDDCSEAVGDWPDVIEVCIASPTGQCQYSYEDNHESCIHCGKGDGVL